MADHKNSSMFKTFQRSNSNLDMQRSFLTAGLKRGYIMKAQCCMLLKGNDFNSIRVNALKWLCSTVKVFYLVACVFHIFVTEPLFINVTAHS